MHKNHTTSRLFLSGSLAVICLAAGAFFLSLVRPASASPLAQAAIYTPTPGPDGRIIYIVKPNDTLLSISLISGVPVDKLRGLNNLTNDTIIAGQPLLLGLAGPAEVVTTPGALPTATPLLPTPTPQRGFGNLCIMLFNDLNGDAIRQTEEVTIPDGAISVNNRSGSVSETAKTVAGSDPYCFTNIPEGDYNITVAIPEGYNPTTLTNYALTLKAGDETFIDFGGQADSETVAAAPEPGSGSSGTSPVLGILGVVIILAGIGLAIFAGRLMKG